MLQREVTTGMSERPLMRCYVKTGIATRRTVPHDCGAAFVTWCAALCTHRGMGMKGTFDSDAGTALSLASGGFSHEPP